MVRRGAQCAAAAALALLLLSTWALNVQVAYASLRLTADRAADGAAPNRSQTAAPLGPDPAVLDVWRGRAFKLLPPAVPKRAAKHCRRWGGFLASIHSKEESLFVGAMLWPVSERCRTAVGPTAPCGIYHIGLWAPTASSPRWADGTVLDYTNWEAAEAVPAAAPADRCGVMAVGPGRRGRWRLDSCTVALPFLCKKPLLDPPAPGGPTAELTAPAVAHNRPLDWGLFLIPSPAGRPGEPMGGAFSPPRGAGASLWWPAVQDGEGDKPAAALGIPFPAGVAPPNPAAAQAPAEGTQELASPSPVGLPDPPGLPGQAALLREQHALQAKAQREAWAERIRYDALAAAMQDQREREAKGRAADDLFRSIAEAAKSRAADRLRGAVEGAPPPAA